jgi:hypothetical protein
MPDFAPKSPVVPAVVSVVDVLARPDEFDGRRVRILGLLDKSRSGLYFAREHAVLNLTKLGVAVDLMTCEGTPILESNLPGLQQLGLQYVYIEATFSRRIHGGMGVFPSGLCGPTSVQPAGVLDEISPTLELNPVNGKAAPLPISSTRHP